MKPSHDMIRKTESEKAANILRRMLQYGQATPGLTPKDREWALRLAISILEARTLDAEDD